MSSLPLLYSFRRCPYAIRARLALAISSIQYEHCEVSLKSKPEGLMTVSPKGTVPVLVLRDGTVIEESLDIMLWAFHQRDPENCIRDCLRSDLELIEENDHVFKPWLDKYKYADRHLEYSQDYYRAKGLNFISGLEERLINTHFLNGPTASIADVAIFPFIRQFAHVDRGWFFSTDYPKVINWLNQFLESERFISVMKKREADVSQKF